MHPLETFGVLCEVLEAAEFLRKTTEAKGETEKRDLFERPFHRFRVFFSARLTYILLHETLWAHGHEKLYEIGTWREIMDI